MKKRHRHGGSQLAPATRVGAAVALIMGVFYVGVAVPVDVVYSRHLVAQVDARLADRLQDITSEGALHLAPDGRVPPDRDVHDAPVIVWLVRRGTASSLTGGAPALSAKNWAPSRGPQTATLSGGVFRLKATALGQRDWLVAGQSLAQAAHLEAVVQRAEVVLGPLFILAMFLGSVAIGVVASRPVEQARRRQLEFTADASHELRTPLTVLEAEVGLALGTRREADSYRATLERIGTEGERLRHIVEDLLFLARSDSAPPPPRDEPVDLGALADACAQRFTAVAHARGTTLWVATQADKPLLVNAPPGWADRLCTVLVDNACRYAGHDGQVRLSVSTRGNFVVLAVDDSGPGVPVQERPLLFNRFHRATDEGGGTGLGLAIADAVVRSTGGRWRVEDSDLGGAHMEVSWRAHQVHRAPRERAVPSSGAGAKAIARD